MVPVVATAGGTSSGSGRPCCADRQKGSEAVSPVAIVWPCPLAVDAYAAAGRDLGFPRPDCPSCGGPLVFWSGVPALCPGGAPVVEDLRAPAAVRPVRGEPCAACVHAGLAAGCGRHPSCPRRARQQGESRGLTVRSGRQTAPLASTSAVRVHSVNPPGTFRTCTARSPCYASDGGALPLRDRTGTTLTRDSR